MRRPSEPGLHRLPDLDRAIVATGGNVLAVGRPECRVDVGIMPVICIDLLAAQGIPNLDGGILAS